MYGENVLEARATHLYKLMLNSNVGPNVCTSPFLVEAYAIRLSLFEGKQMHNHALKLGFGSDVHVRSTLIAMYADCEEGIDALKVFNEAPMMASFVCHSLLEVSTRCGCDEKAEFLYNLMPEHDPMTSNLMIAVFWHACMIEKAYQLMDKIPDTISWRALIDSFYERDMYEGVLYLFIRMHANGIAIDKLVVEVVLRVCTHFDLPTLKKYESKVQMLERKV